MSIRRKLLTVTVTSTAVFAGTLVVAPTPAEAVSPVRIYRIWYDSPGVDTRTNASINA